MHKSRSNWARLTSAFVSTVESESCRSGKHARAPILLSWLIDSQHSRQRESVQSPQTIQPRVHTKPIVVWWRRTILSHQVSNIHQTMLSSKQTYLTLLILSLLLVTSVVQCQDDDDEFHDRTPKGGFVDVDVHEGDKGKHVGVHVP